ncbi:MAG: hypothetical protein ACHQ5A_02365 [Opitutales bacterium]
MKTSLQLSTPAAALIAAVLLGAMAGAARAEEPITTTAAQINASAAGQSPVTATAEISGKFTAFAGSSANATALVTGLRAGTAITLTATVNGQVMTTTIQPATGAMGYGETFIALSLAQKSLAQAGITSPTPAQIQAALDGGTITGSSGQSVALTGVLTLRKNGDGWGEIAKTLNVKLGTVVSDLHAVRDQMNISAAIPADPVTGKGRADAAIAGTASTAIPGGGVLNRPSWAANAGLGAGMGPPASMGHGGRH